MPDPTSTGRVARFGVFKFALGTGDLCKNGSRCILTGQPAQVLNALLENAGEVVTRETLCKRLWPDGTFVDFEHSLRVAINRIRDVLGDSADSPRFIETVRGRGWRFIAPVAWENQKNDTHRAPEHSDGLSLAEAKSRSRSEAADSGSDGPGTAASGTRWQPVPPAEVHSPSLASSHGLRNFMLAGLAVVVAALALASYFWPRGGLRVTGFTQLTDDGLKKADGGPLLTDGSRVYFWEYRGNGLVLASTPADGGEVAEAPLPPGFHATDISKSGAEFLGDDTTRRGAESLAAVSVPGKSLQWLMQPHEPGGGEPWPPNGSWSPDGSKITYSVWNQLFVSEADGSGIRQVASMDGWVSLPSWSPDGGKLCFSVMKPKTEKYALWEVNADGTDLHPLRFPGQKFTETRWGKWTPNGRFLIFDAEQDGRRDIWAVRQGGIWFGRADSKPVRLTSGPLNYYSPLPSRDGNEIFVLGEESRGELMRFDLKSNSFVDFLHGISAAEVNFSRNGQWITYVTYPDYTLWRAHSDGSDVLQLTFPPLEAREPHWSPDGRQIAFQGISRNAHYKIYLVSSDGGTVREAVPGAGEESVGTWWPDGRALLYDEPLYRHDPSQMFLHRVDLTAGKTYRIPHSGGSWTARLSPDGRYIATLDAAPRAVAHRLLILDAGTGARVFSLSMSEVIHEPTWSHDGEYVYFATLDPPAPALYRVRLRDKKLEQLVSLKGFPVAGLWTGVAPDGSPLLLRDTSTEEIYAIHVRLP